MNEEYDYSEPIDKKDWKYYIDAYNAENETDITADDIESVSKDYDVYATVTIRFKDKSANRGWGYDVYRVPGDDENAFTKLRQKCEKLKAENKRLKRELKIMKGR